VKNLASSKVLVTGAGGFIGSHLCELCLESGAEVRALVHYNSRNDWGMLEDLNGEKLRDIEVITGDLRDFQCVRRAVRGCSFVFHLGALIGIPYSYQSPSDVVSTNVMGTLNVLQASLESAVDRHLQTSTSEVYGTAQYVPMDEKHPLNPQSPYAASKVGSDKLAESFFLSYGLPVTIVRPFNTYGPRQSLRAVIPTIIAQALVGETVRLGSTSPSRDLTFVSDTARGFTLAAVSERALGRTVQLGSQSESSISDLVHIIGTLVGRELKIETDTARTRPDASEVDRLLASNQYARELLDWRPEVPLIDGLRRTIDWFRARGERTKRDLYHV
jgi:NAD dependent epimerase/dehydratase